MTEDEEREAIRGEGGNVVDFEAAKARAASRRVFNVKGPEHIYAPLPPEEHVIGGLLKRSSLMLLGGYGSSGKTWMALDLVTAVALGQPWMGRLSCTKGKALFLDYESGDRETRRRLQALARSRGLDRVEGVGMDTMPNGYLFQPQFERELVPLASHSDLIVIDSLKASSPGADENDSKIREGLDVLRRVGETNDCAFVVLVHSKKRGGESGGDEREVLRGSSGIFDAADAVLVSTWDRDKERFDIGQTKARQGKALDPFSVRLVDEDGGTRLEAQADEVLKDESFDELCARVLRSTRSRPDMGTVALREAVGGRAKAVDAAVEYLVNRGQLTDFGDRSGHRYRAFEKP